MVNDRMETTVPGIYAAGDVAVTKDSITGELVNNAIWPSAARQGAIAGQNMAGGDSRYLINLTVNALELLGLRLSSAGHSFLEEEDGVEVYQKEDGFHYRKLVVKDNRLIGFILIGDIKGAGFLFSLMKRQTEMPVSPRSLLNGPLEYHDCLPPNYGYENGFLARLHH